MAGGGDGVVDGAGVGVVADGMVAVAAHTARSVAIFGQAGQERDEEPNELADSGVVEPGERLLEQLLTSGLQSCGRVTADVGEMQRLATSVGARPPFDEAGGFKTRHEPHDPCPREAEDGREEAHALTRKRTQGSDGGCRLTRRAHDRLQRGALCVDQPHAERP